MVRGKKDLYGLPIRIIWSTYREPPGPIKSPWYSADGQLVVGALAASGCLFLAGKEHLAELGQFEADEKPLLSVTATPWPPLGQLASARCGFQVRNRLRLFLCFH